MDATLGMSHTWPSRPITEVVIASPNAAVRIGNPIAIRLPKTRARITIAATLPSTSLSCVSGADRTLPICPPTATRIPAARAGWVASSTSVARFSVMKPLPTLRSTGMIPVRPSSEMIPAASAFFPTGFCTLST